MSVLKNKLIAIIKKKNEKKSLLEDLELKEKEQIEAIKKKFSSKKNRLNDDLESIVSESKIILGEATMLLSEKKMEKFEVFELMNLWAGAENEK